MRTALGIRHHHKKIKKKKETEIENTHGRIIGQSIARFNPKLRKKEL